MKQTNMIHKKNFKPRVNIYSSLAVIGGIVFGVVMGSGLFIFLSLGLATITYFNNSK